MTKRAPPPGREDRFVLQRREATAMCQLAVATRREARLKLDAGWALLAELERLNVEALRVEHALSVTLSRLAL